MEQSSIYSVLIRLHKLALAIWLIYPFHVDSAQWRVNPDGPPLEQVLQKAVAGDRLLLAPGHYYAPQLYINKPLILEGMEGAIIDGQGKGNVITIKSSDVTIQNLILRGSGNNLTKMNSVIFVEQNATHAEILNNIIISKAFGIWVDGTKNVKILKNHIQGDSTIRSQDRGNGVHLFNTEGATVADNEIWHTRDGIYIDTSNYNILKNNHIHHLRYGIHYMYSHHNQIIGNRTNNTRTGYALMQSKNLTVKNNRSVYDDNYGILLNYIINSTIENNYVMSINTAPDSTVEIKRVPGAESKALFVYNSQFNTIYSNVFSHSDIGIHLTAGSEDNTLYGNNFIQNRVQVKYVATRQQEWSHNGVGNYWSDYLGWDLNADGIGDRPYEPNDAVDRMLWKYPSAKILMHSPAIKTLRWVQEQFPVLRPPGVRDSFPLMKQYSVSKGDL